MEAQGPGTYKLQLHRMLHLDVTQDNHCHRKARSRSPRLVRHFRSGRCRGRWNRPSRSRAD